LIYIVFSGELSTLLRQGQGLYCYVEQEMQEVYGSKWMTKVDSHLRDYQKSKQPVNDIICEDVSALLKVVDGEWDKVFKSSLSQSDRAFVNELIEVRNQWAHRSTFLTDYTYRAVDTVLQLLKSISDPQLADVEKQRQDVLHLLYQEQVRHEVQTIPVSSTEEAYIKKHRLGEPLKHISFQNAYPLNDVKGSLQQLVLACNPSHKPPEYKTIRSGGTDNNPEFTSVVYVAGSEYGSGKGSSTKRAEKRAAEDALQKLGLL
jgi:hypothetical protein